MNINLIKARTMKTSFLMLFVVLTMVLGGCSSDYLRDDYRRPSARVITKIPEIRQQTRRPKTAPKKVVKPYVKPYKPQVKKYTITSSKPTVITPKKVMIIPKKQASIDIDPYASIPESSSSKNSRVIPSENVKPKAYKSSAAVKSLMMRARADLAIGNSQLAISKLERGLRIDSQNPDVWHLLAKAQYNQSNHQQAITMAKKSIRYSSDDGLISQNWKLIQKSGEKSDDAIAIKEALGYFKANP